MSMRLRRQLLRDKSGPQATLSALAGRFIRTHPGHGHTRTRGSKGAVPVGQAVWANA
jgi:hypothetical protein